MPPGPERGAMAKKVRQAKIAENVEQWLASLGSKPPA
jgi:hypothetical protein